MYNKVLKDTSQMSNFDKGQQCVLHQAAAFLQPYTNYLYQQMEDVLYRLRIAIQALLLAVFVLTDINNRKETPLIVMLQN